MWYSKHINYLKAVTAQEIGDVIDQSLAEYGLECSEHKWTDQPRQQAARLASGLGLPHFPNGIGITPATLSSTKCADSSVRTRCPVPSSSQVKRAEVARCHALLHQELPVEV